MGPRRGGPPGAKGKPKNTKDTVKRLFAYVGKYKLRLFAVLICMLLTSVSSLIGSFMLAPIINKIAIHVSGTGSEKLSIMEQLSDNIITKITGSVTGPLEELVDFSRFGDYGYVMMYIFVALLILIAVYVVEVAANYAQSRIMMTVSQGSLEAIRNDLFAKLQKLPVRYFDNHPTGEIMSRFTNDVDNIGMMLDNSLISVISGAVTIVGTLVFMFTTNVLLTVITVVFVPIFAKGGVLIASKSHKYYSGQQAALGAINGYIEETVTGQKVIKVFNHEDDSVEEFSYLNDDLRDKQFKSQFYGGIMGPIMGNTSQISYALTVGIGGILMCVAGMMPGALTVFAQYSKRFSFPINNISQQTSAIFSALAGAERVFAVIDSPEEPADVRDAKVFDDDEGGMKGYVELKNVTFGYNPDKTVLKNISLYAKPGQKIAFVGSTGAGKTTITNLLNRFYDIEEGEITIDGVNIKDIKREHLRENIAMVLQDTHLFSGTVRENIRYGRLDATDEEVEQAAKTASAHSFIMRLENGYDTLLEGDGANLSQGQRQLLNIARAALSKAPILVLDEATSSVDTRTERHIEHGMDRLMKDRTTFVIAHRLSTVRNSDAIMVLERGEIIERGDHEQLLAQKGRYYELYTGKVELD
ncbi:MAG: ABC transporter ATP-binding protein [Clostridia bacterium]|nr:ABC transporter ATP-binding protein [Clostridia bacterium]